MSAYNPLKLIFKQALLQYGPEYAMLVSDPYFTPLYEEFDEKMALMMGKDEYEKAKEMLDSEVIKSYIAAQNDVFILMEDKINETTDFVMDVCPIADEIN